ncbi:hypothetical protein IAQ61_002698 [Plenodomus lingam]|uniref:uncharacterized protein n=1 Tax=Leptosphaeria maculans TaxID=5022 RepID=UPI00332C86AA|nr:hypothetical protein IAQ61_002698 [Plenodomus lingam]
MFYDKWHETELERWLKDHNVPHPGPSDRKSLVNTVKAHWNDKVVTPYTSWDVTTLGNYLSLKGQQAKKGTEQDAKSLAEQVKVYWTETEDSANQAYGSVKDWIFDSLNAQGAYASVSSAAADAQQSLSDALLDSWSDSQIKEWADKNGIKVPQGSKRNELIALARKHRARLYGDSASATAGSAYGAATSKANNQYAAATGGFAYYTDLIKQQIGLAAASATSATSVAGASASSASSVASARAKSLTGAAAKAASSSSSSISKSAASASAAAEKSASSAASAASKSAKSGYDAAAASASSASKKAKDEL